MSCSIGELNVRGTVYMYDAGYAGTAPGQAAWFFEVKGGTLWRTWTRTVVDQPTKEAAVAEGLSQLRKAVGAG